MSHYDIKYDSSKPRAQRDAEAVRDIQEYLGMDKYRKTFGDMFIRSHDYHARYAVIKAWIRQIQICCMVAGISGYPVGALVRYFIANLNSHEVMKGSST